MQICEVETSSGDADVTALESDDPTSSSWLQPPESCAVSSGTDPGGESSLAKTDSMPLAKVEAVTLVLTVQPGTVGFPAVS